MLLFLIKKKTQYIIDKAIAIVAGVQITDLLNVTKQNIPKKKTCYNTFLNRG